ncbi:hypothetical protein TREES_T100011919 [Tupaia chinensis]|uniref:Uncharacterized protein n=1 Tax=Tupaia chinensis TaxID=246437 RepID=L9KU06_TUPCH|nr:hypothetical protein TREES_T100011919 [Tupaia chinensis]
MRLLVLSSLLCTLLLCSSVFSVEGLPDSGLESWDPAVSIHSPCSPKTHARWRRRPAKPWRARPCCRQAPSPDTVALKAETCGAGAPRLGVEGPAAVLGSGPSPHHAATLRSHREPGSANTPQSPRDDFSATVQTHHDPRQLQIHGAACRSAGRAPRGASQCRTGGSAFLRHARPPGVHPPSVPAS